MGMRHSLRTDLTGRASGLNMVDDGKAGIKEEPFIAHLSSTPFASAALLTNNLF